VLGTFIFDIVAGGLRFFDHGLRELLTMSPPTISITPPARTSSPPTSSDVSGIAEAVSSSSASSSTPSPSTSTSTSASTRYSPLVMHDCRGDSDALFHQFGCSLGYVFDTQVAHTTLQRARGVADSDLFPIGLNALLYKYAGRTNTLKDGTITYSF
jgi:hypothetical protein